MFEISMKEDDPDCQGLLSDFKNATKKGINQHFLHHLDDKELKH